MNETTFKLIAKNSGRADFFGNNDSSAGMIKLIGLGNKGNIFA